MQTIEQFVKKHGIHFDAHQIPSNPNMSDMPTGSRHWSCTLRRNQGEPFGTLTIPFSQGPAIIEDPTAEDILDCLASDASGIESSAETFEDWCGEYGYDTDSRKAEAIFNACVEQTERLRAFLTPEEFEELLYDTEKL
jgi:hypothetical protein